MNLVQSKLFYVAIVGRSNVGKSSLFNRLIGKKKALVHNTPGVTRDRNEAQGVWIYGKKQVSFSLVDTGGLGGDHFSNEIDFQVGKALEKAACVLFLFDAQTGLTNLDQKLIRKFQKSGTFKKIPFIGVINKVDHESHEVRVADFYSSKISPLISISAEHGRGIEDLKEVLFGYAEKNEFIEETLDLMPTQIFSSLIPKIAIIGKPNVGKSTLLNTIFKEQRVIVSPISGTTVDPIDICVSLNGKSFFFVDTAGVRRKNKTKQGIEVLSVVQTRKTLEKTDIALLVLDGEAGTNEQDEKIGGLVEDSGSGVILIVNKWDTQKKNIKFTPEMAACTIRKKMKFLHYAPLLFVSALKNQGLNELSGLLEEIIHQRKFKISTHEFTQWVRKEIMKNNPMNAKVYLAHQVGKNPPTFVCHVNDPKKVHFSLKRHLINVLREKWGYMGSPVRLHFILAKNRKSLPKKSLKKPLKKNKITR